MATPSSALNMMFMDKLHTQDGKEKVAQYGGNYIRDRLREVSFARQIIPPTNVTKADCHPSIHHDTLVKIVEIEPQSRAMPISFRGEPTVRLIEGKRAETGFFTISSERFEKYEQELLAYEMPITKIIETNSMNDLQEIEDREFILHCEAAVQAFQQEANSGSVTTLNASALVAGSVVEESVRKGELARSAAADNGFVWPLQRVDIVNLCKMLDGNELRTKTILFTEADFNDILSWTVEDFGDKMQSETAVDGYKYTTLVGRAFVRTIKKNILRRGNVYSFTSPEFFGNFWILNNTKFYVDKVANKIMWQCWEDIAMLLVNAASVRKTELYSGDATSHDADGIRADTRPKDVADLGAVNNRVEAGLVFPSVKVY
jgi:hypothetical protein